MTPEERKLADAIRKLCDEAGNCKKRIEKLVEDHKRKTSQNPSPKIIKQIEESLARHVENLREDDGA